MSKFLESLPPNTHRIFEILSSGKFICSLSYAYRDEYEVLADDSIFEDLQAYFQTIHYELEKGEGYFYFAKTQQDKQKAEDKMERLSRYIDIFAFLGAMDTKPHIGSVLRPSQIAEECSSNPALQNRLNSIAMKEVREATTWIGKIRAVLRELADDFFLERKDDEQENYIVLNSFQYLQTIIRLINPNETPA
jgi:hypothetical protein